MKWPYFETFCPQDDRMDSGASVLCLISKQTFVFSVSAIAYPQNIVPHRISADTIGTVILSIYC